MAKQSGIPVAIIGSGNIGTDLMIKVLRQSKSLKMGALVGIDPSSDGLARAQRLGVPVTHEGIDGLLKLPNFPDIRIAFRMMIALPTFAPPMTSIALLVVSVNSSMFARVPGPADLLLIDATISA